MNIQAQNSPRHTSTEKSNKKLYNRHALMVFRACVVTVLCLAAVGCSTKRNTWLSRGYQRLSSHYNVYFNGMEAFDGGIESVRTRNKNDYSRVLPVYEFANAQTAKAGKSGMETALKKSHKLVQLHSITVKPEKRGSGPETAEDKRFRAKEEFNPYVPEGYLLMGKANVVLHEEQEALKYFDYLDRKHAGERPTYEGTIWKAIAYTQMGQYNNALATLKGYDTDGIAPANLYADYQAAYANVFICQEMYAQAIPYMEHAAAETKDRHCARRYNYILAQLYRTTGDKAKAAPIFLKLSKGLQDYDMAFAAKMDLATVATTDEERLKAEKSLQKMAGEPKYENEQDQVYYALGHLEQSKGNVPRAEHLFIKSTQLSVDNDNQKGLSFLALADIYQAEPRYIEASTSLDSAATYLDDANLRKPEAQERAKLLAPLGEQLRTIRDNDSLMTIARMDAKSREKLLAKMVKDDEDRRQAAADAREAAEQGALSQSDYYQMAHNMTAAGGQNANWYFYNTQLVTAGKSTFRSRWGNRKNEDNWRRKDKSSSMMGGMGSGMGPGMDPDAIAGLDDEAAQAQEVQEAMTAAEANGPLSVNKLMAGLPLTADAQRQKDDETAGALLKSASILYDDLQDYPSAVRQLEELLRRYPDDSRRPDALALLHFAQQRSGDAAGMRETDRLIAREYPNSKMAQYLAQPDYLQSEQARHDAGERRYEETYNAYLANDFGSAVAMSSAALGDQTTEEAHRPRYLLVRAMAHAKNGNAADFRADLTEIGRSWAGTPQDSTAKKLLALLDEGKMPVRHTAYQSPLAEAQISAEAETEVRKAEYLFQPDSTQYILCIIDNGKAKEAQFAIADYNFSNYLLQDYDLEMRNIAVVNAQGEKEKRQAIVVRSFANLKEAQVYFYAVREQTFWKELSSDALPQIFMVSQQNYRLVGLSGVDDAFRKFVKENYGL